MIRRVFLIFLFLSAVPAWSETVAVRTGEHADFSRIVFALERPSEWTLGRVEGGYKLKFSRQDIDFDLSQVFYYIPRERLTAAEATGSAEILLEVAEGIHVEVLQLNPRILVLDLRAGPAPSGSPFENPLESVKNYTPPKFFAEETILPFYWRDFLFSKKEYGASSVVPGFSRGEEGRQLDISPTRLKNAETDLIGQISHAASMGLIETNRSGSVLAEIYNSDIQNTDRLSIDYLKGSISSYSGGRDDYNLFVRPYIFDDRSSRARRQGGVLNSDGDECFPDVELALASWRGDMDGLDRLRYLNSNLIGEFDASSLSVAEEFAKYYLSIGFGVEAISVLRAFDLLEDSNPTLPLLASIIEGWRISEDEPIRKMLACDGAAALWAVLANESISSGEFINTSAIQRNFSILPAEMRRHIGPRLSKILIEIGDVAAAHSVSRMISRAPINSFSAVSMIESFRALTYDPSSVPSLLEPVVNENVEISLDALLMSIEASYRAGLRVSSDVLERIVAAAIEFRFTERAEAAISAYIVAAGTVGKFDVSFDVLKNSKNIFDADAHQKILERLGWQILAIDLESEFLKNYFSYKASLQPVRLGWDLRRSLAEKLLNSGFSKEALSLLADGGDVHDGGQLLIARSLLKEGDAYEAFRVLGDLQGSAVDTLRSEAVKMMENYMEEPQIFRNLNARGASVFLDSMNSDLYMGQLSSSRELIAESELLRSRFNNIVSDIR